MQEKCSYYCLQCPKFRGKVSAAASESTAGLWCGPTSCQQGVHDHGRGQGTHTNVSAPRMPHMDARTKDSQNVI